MRKGKLVVELVPFTMWGKNLRAALSRESWEELRCLFGATGEVCSVCSTKVGIELLELHEVWYYNDKNLLQKLVDLIPICSSCHLSKHIGRAGVIGLHDKAFRQLLKVNGWTKNDAEKHISEASKKWVARSNYEYTLDISFIERWIPESKIHLNWIEKRPRWVSDRLGAIEWAQNVLKSDAIILDTETTGLLVKKNVEAIQIAAINMQGDVLCNSLLKPKYKIPKRVIKIHGVTNECVVECPTFKEEYKKIFKILDGKIIVTYNQKFDSQIIKRTCELWHLPPIDCQWQCAMHVYRVYMKSGRYLALSEKKHDALDDCFSVLKLIREMADVNHA